MARTRTYKRLEKSIVYKFGLFIKKNILNVIHLFGKFFSFFDRKLTIMIVPHSQSKVINFRTNIFSLLFGTVLVIGMITSFFYFNKKSSSTSVTITRLEEENKKTLASLDELRDENQNLLQAAQQFQGALSHALSLIGINQTRSTRGTNSNSDLSALFGMEEISKGAIKETGDIKKLTMYLEGAVQPIEEIGKMLETQGALFSDTPNIWPLKGGIGHISMEFGQAIHPILGQWYIHKGLDISTYRTGDPIVATANGQVVTVAMDPAFGHNIVIKHKHGYYTRYAHMNTVYAKIGQYVSQGDVIGTVGNTGLSTGAHLHYEVHIGSNVVDPAKFINIKVK